MIKCEACGKEAAKYHITVRVIIAGPKRNKVKLAQFWLCETCELANQQVMAQDPFLRGRVAARLTENSAFMSATSEWHGRRGKHDS